MLSRRPIQAAEEHQEIGGFNNVNIRAENELPSSILQ